LFAEKTPPKSPPPKVPLIAQSWVSAESNKNLLLSQIPTFRSQIGEFYY